MEEINNACTRCQREGFYFGYGWSTSSATQLAQRLGRPSGDVRDPRIVRAISPQAHSAALKNSLSSRYGLGAFPFHTDTAYRRIPARYLILRCIDPGPGGRQTIIVNTALWQMARYESELLHRALWKVRAAQPFLATLMERTSWGSRMRLDFDCMSPATSDAGRAREVVQDIIASTSRVTIDWSADALLVIDNWRCIHARGAAAIPDENRRLERILVWESL